MSWPRRKGHRRNWLGPVRTASGGMRRHKVQAIAIGLVVLVSTASATLGLALLAISAGPEGHHEPHGAARFVLPACVLVLGVAGFAAGRLPDPARSAVLGAVAGLGFGVVAIAARVLPGFAPGRLIAEPRRRRLALALSHGEIRVRDMVCGLLERVCGRLAPWR